MDLEMKVKNLESKVQKLRTEVDELYNKSAAHYEDLAVILNVLREGCPEVARKYGIK